MNFQFPKKRFSFELFGNGKQMGDGLCLSQKVDEKMILISALEISMILQDPGNMFLDVVFIKKRL